MFTKYKQLILSAFVLICCLTDIMHAKSRVKILDYDMHHHYKQLSRSELHKATLAMHHAHQRVLSACICPQAYCQTQQHELLKHIAQLQAQCAHSQETTRALQLQQEKTTAIVNQLTEELVAMQQQYTDLEKKYKNLEQPVSQQESKEPQNIQQGLQDTQEVEQPTHLAQETQENQESTQLPEQSSQPSNNTTLELQEQPQPDQVQQALLDELSGKKRAAQPSQEPQESSNQVPVLESKEPHPELQLDDIDQETQQEPTQQNAPENNANNTNTQESIQDTIQDQPQEIEAVMPETVISGNSTIDEDEEDAAFEQRLLDLLQEKQEIIHKLTQEKQALEHENAQARQTIAQLQQELEKYQVTLQEALEPLTTHNTSQNQQPQEQVAYNAHVEQQELKNYQNTLNEMLNLYDQQLTEKKTLEQNLKKAHEYIDQQQIEQQQAKQEVHKTHKTHKTLLKKSQEFERELQERSIQLKRAFNAFNNEHQQLKELKKQVLKPRISQATQTQIEDTLLTNVDVQTKYISLVSFPHTYTHGTYLEYMLTFNFDDKTIVMNTQDTLEQNRQAKEELITILTSKEELESEELIKELDACLQEVLSNCSNPEECVMILFDLFYRDRVGSVIHPPHPIIAKLTFSTLSDLADNNNLPENSYLMSYFHKERLKTMIEATCTAINNRPTTSESNIVENQDIQDLSNQEQKDTQKDNQKVEEQEPLKQAQSEQQPSQRSWSLNPFNWFRR